VSHEPIDLANPVTIIDAVGALVRELVRDRDEALRQLANANRINQEMATATTKLERENARLKAQPPAELTTQAVELGNAIRQINDVVHRQFALLDGTGSLTRAADIRRRQVAKGYTPEHDDHEGEVALVNAASALVMHRPGLWPWRPAHFTELYDDPDRMLHAAALLCAAQDVIDRKRKAKGNA
jgi:hypothetical protein